MKKNYILYSLLALCANIHIFGESHLSPREQQQIVNEITNGLANIITPMNLYKTLETRLKDISVLDESFQKQAHKRLLASVQPLYDGFKEQLEEFDPQSTLYKSHIKSLIQLQSIIDKLSGRLPMIKSKEAQDSVYSKTARTMIKQFDPKNYPEAQITTINKVIDQISDRTEREMLKKELSAKQGTMKYSPSKP